MKNVWLVSLSIITFLVSGCMLVPVPGAEVVSPEISGRVIDGKTKLPVSGAKVSVMAKEGFSAPSTETDREGNFHLPRHRRYYIMSIATVDPVYRIPPVPDYTARIEIAHPEYETLWIEPASRGTEARKGEMGDIEIVTRQ